MHIFNIIFLVYFLSFENQALKKIGTFWHISDVYWLSEPKEKCLKPVVACINSTLTALKERSGRFHPDFVLWSSAGGPYFKSAIRQIKKLIQNIVVLPSLPPIKLPASDKYILYYQNMTDYFGNWLDEQAHRTFWKAGYYSRNLGIPEKLQIIVLNTALFCKFHVASELDDPADQWTWLSLELIKARKDKKVVYLLLSATPGIATTYDNRMFTCKHNRRYIAMVRTFADVIKGQFGGYGEGNQFHIFYDKNERGCGWLMLSPPFHEAARLFLYDTETLEPIDYVQFYKKDEKWHIQHRFSSYYLLPNISTFSLELLGKKMQRNEDIHTKYISATKQLQDAKCKNRGCSKLNMCNIMAVDYSTYSECMVEDKITPQLFPRDNHNVSYLVTGYLFLVKCCFSVLIINKFFI